MIVRRYPCVEITDLEEEIHFQYGIDVDIAPLFNFLNNDCYEILAIHEENDEDPEQVFTWESPDAIIQRNLVRAHLRDLFPNDEIVLVEISY